MVDCIVHCCTEQFSHKLMIKPILSIKNFYTSHRLTLRDRSPQPFQWREKENYDTCYWSMASSKRNLNFSSVLSAHDPLAMKIVMFCSVWLLIPVFSPGGSAITHWVYDGSCTSAWESKPLFSELNPVMDLFKDSRHKTTGNSTSKLC